MKRNKVFGLLMMLAIIYCFCGCSDDSVENRSPAPVQNSMAASSPASSAKRTATPWKAPTATPLRFVHDEVESIYYEWLYDSKTDSYQYHFLGRKDGTKCKKTSRYLSETRHTESGCFFPRTAGMDPGRKIREILSAGFCDFLHSGAENLSGLEEEQDGTVRFMETGQKTPEGSR